MRSAAKWCFQHKKAIAWQQNYSDSQESDKITFVAHCSDWRKAKHQPGWGYQVLQVQVQITSFLAACAIKGPGPSPCLFPDMFRSLPLALSMPQGPIGRACLCCSTNLNVVTCELVASTLLFLMLMLLPSTTLHVIFFGLDAPLGGFNLNATWLNQGKYK